MLPSSNLEIPPTHLILFFTYVQTLAHTHAHSRVLIYCKESEADCFKQHTYIHTYIHTYSTYIHIYVQQCTPFPFQMHTPNKQMNTVWELTWGLYKPLHGYHYTYYIHTLLLHMSQTVGSYETCGMQYCPQE